MKKIKAMFAQDYELITCLLLRVLRKEGMSHFNLFHKNLKGKKQILTFNNNNLYFDAFKINMRLEDSKSGGTISSIWKNHHSGISKQNRQDAGTVIDRVRGSHQTIIIGQYFPEKGVNG